MGTLTFFAAALTLPVLLATADVTSGCLDSTRRLLARDSRRLRPSQKSYFTISPTTGNPTGGTQVVLYLNEELMDAPINPYYIRCAFGDKAMPAQSFFQDPDSITPALAVLCEAPAGPAKNSVVVRLSLDGTKFYTGPQFTYRTEKSALASAKDAA